MSRHCLTLLGKRTTNHITGTVPMKSIHRYFMMSVNKWNMSQSSSSAEHSNCYEISKKSNFKNVHQLYDQCQKQFIKLGYVRSSTVESILEEMTKETQTELGIENMDNLFSYIFKSYGVPKSASQPTTEKMWTAFSAHSTFSLSKTKLLQMMSITETHGNKDTYKLILQKLLPLIDEMDVSELEVLISTCAAFGDVASVDVIVATCQTKGLDDSRITDSGVLLCLSVCQPNDIVKISQIRQRLHQDPALDSRGYYALLKSSILLNDFKQFHLTATTLGTTRRRLTRMQYSCLLYLAVENHQQDFIEYMVNDYKYFSSTLQIENAVLDLLNSKKLREAKSILNIKKAETAIDLAMMIDHFSGILKNMDQEDVLNFCKELDNKTTSQKIFQAFLLIKLKEKNWDFVWRILHVMREKHCPIKFQYLSPIFIQDSSYENGYECLAKAHEFGVEIKTHDMEEVIIPKLLSSGDSIDSIVKQLEKEISSEELLFTSLVSVLISSNRWEEALLIVNNDKKLYVNHLLIVLDRHCEENISLAMQILSALCKKQNPNTNNVDLCGYLLLRVTNGSVKTNLILVDILKEMLKHDIKISNESGDRLMISQKVSKEAKNILKKVMHTPDSPEFSSEEYDCPNKLEELLSNVEPMQENQRKILINLLYSYCNEKDAEKIRRILLKLAPDQEVNKKALYNDVITASKTYALDEALIKFKLLSVHHPDYAMQPSSILFLATSLVNVHRTKEAATLIRNYSKKASNYIQLQEKDQSYIKKFLLACSKHSYEVTAFFFNLLVKTGMVSPNVYSLHTHVLAHIESGNLKEAVDEYISIVENYHLFVPEMEIISAIYKRIAQSSDQRELLESRVLLQKVSKIASQKYSNLDIKSVVACVLAGFIPEAKILLNSCHEKLKEHGEFPIKYLVFSRNTEAIENFLEISKPYKFDRTELCLELLHQYRYVKDVDKAKKLKEDMENYGIVQNEEFERLFSYLAKSEVQIGAVQ